MLQGIYIYQVLQLRMTNFMAACNETVHLIIRNFIYDRKTQDSQSIWV